MAEPGWFSRRLCARRIGGPTRRLVVAAVAAIAAMALLGSTASAHPRPGVVRVDSGLLRGKVAEDHISYSAIPYAAAPVGERRWRPPARPPAWSGVRDATGPSPLCPQGGGGDVLGQEDCLFLDVTAPKEVRRGARLPVLVWLHGGGLDSGGPQRFDGARLATAGGIWS